ncbi:50S ribosomal protein L15 [bacterium]|nr:50S ribosomal protein L15 [bacterium]
MDLSNLKYADGAKKNRKRIGRGQGSGTGKTSGKGHKGQKARAGASHRAWFEGGQMPLQRRVPKRGFTNIFRRSFHVVNLGDLAKLTQVEITPEILLEARLIRKKRALVKVLGNGEISTPLEIKAHAFSKSAIEKIEKAGGKAIVL